MVAITNSLVRGLAAGRGHVLAAAALAMFILLPTIGCGGEEGYAIPKPSPYPTAGSTLPSTPTVAPVPAVAAIDLSNNLFTPNILEVEAGKIARFQLVGDGEPHTFTIAKLGVDIAIPREKGSFKAEFFVPSGTAGDLELVCNFHRVVGMVGTVRVR